jgi:hypothetical protein
MRKSIKASVRMASLLAKKREEYIPNASLGYYHYTDHTTAPDTCICKVHHKIGGTNCAFMSTRKHREKNHGSVKRQYSR